MMKQLNKTNLGWLILIALMAVVLFVGVSSNVISPFYQITLVTISDQHHPGDRAESGHRIFRPVLSGTCRFYGNRCLQRRHHRR